MSTPPPPPPAGPGPPLGHLEARSMLLLAFHVIDVPGDRCHGHNSLLHHLTAPRIRALRPVLAQLLEGRRPGRGRRTEEG